MATIKICDICKEEIKEDQKIQKIRIQQYVEDVEIQKEENPDMVFKDACNKCADLHSFAWDNDDNIKALFLSIKQRQARLGKPKTKKTA